MDTEMCRSHSADCLGSVGNLCCVSVFTHKNKKNPSGEITQGKANIGYHDFYSNSFPFMESHTPFTIFHLLNDNTGNNGSTEIILLVT